VANGKNGKVFSILMKKASKETPGTYVYNEVSDDPIVPSLYIRKTAFPNDNPPPSIELIAKLPASS
jgi:hypothetical protein